ncbi:MAG: energy-coupling factor ABC transporter ATP-binding protein [Bacteroidetes bacterium]|nr:energy-coupling factor ABC transporter ATP-binding protein [Bacteroidota bacterium]
MKIVYDGVSFSYPSKTALKNVSCEISPGSVALVVGHNGSGKSTFLKLMNGILKPTQGDVRLEDVNTRDKRVSELARYCALSFQNPDDQLFASTVMKELRFGSENIMGDGSLVDAVSGILHLEDYLQMNPLSLTYALRRLVAIGGSMAMDTPILALDEPTSGLSQREKAYLGSLISHSKSLKKTVVIVTHDLNFLLPFADDILMLSHGEVRYFGGRDNLFDRNDVRQLMAGCGVRYPIYARMSATLGAGKYCYEGKELIDELIKRKAGAAQRTNGQHQLEGA